MQPAVLGALVGRCGKPIYHSPKEVSCVAKALVRLSSYCPSPPDQSRLLRPVRHFALRDPSFLAAFLQDTNVVDPRETAHGRRAALVLRALPPSQGPSVSAVLRDATLVVVAALQSAAWPAADLRAALVVLRQRGAYDAALVAALTQYLAAQVGMASAAHVPSLVAMATLLPELYSGPGKGIVAELANRVALVAAELSPAMVGAICGCFNRVQLRHGTVALALQEEADRIAQSCDARTSVEFLLFISRQEAKFVSSDSAQWLLERVMGESLDSTAILHLCRALRSLPLALKEQLRGDLVDVLSFVSSQMTEVLERERGARSPSAYLALESTQVLLVAFLGLHKVLGPAPKDLSSTSPVYMAAVENCAGLIAEGLEDLEEGVRSLPFSITSALLEVPSDAARRCGVHIVREHARECVHLPALQTFRYLLLLGDAGVRDDEVLRYLRKCFCKTAADIPPAQLCTALRCFAVCDRAQPLPSTQPSTSPGADASADVEAELRREDSDSFLRFAAELVRQAFARGVSMRLALVLLEALYGLGCRDKAFFEDAAAFLDARRTTATAQMHAAETAATVCLALGEDILDQYPDLHVFLLSVEAAGTKGEAQLPPSAWMDLYDPANAVGPLTEHQQESWDIVDKMAATRADDHDTLATLGKAYLELLPHARPDDLKYFFAVCADKVLKEDQLLREGLERLVATGISSRLSGATIGSILHSLAALRFAYPRASRRFLESVSAEQWHDMDAAPLVEILTAMARLSLRMPRQLDIIGERVAALSRFLAPRDIAEAVRALQTLGHRDEAVVQSLVDSAAARASGFDEIGITVLFTTPSVHRLLRTPEVALPLLRRACGVVSSPLTRQRIATKVRRSGVSRELLESCTAELRMLSGPAATQTPRLT